MIAAGAMFFGTFILVDIVMNGGNGGDVLRQRAGALRRLYMPSHPKSEMKDPDGRTSGGSLRIPVLQRPAIEPPETDVVADAAEVIGVSIGDWHRAYAVHVMTIPAARVISDVIGGTGIVVTYNASEGRARVLSDASGGDKLAVSFRENREGKMEIEINGRDYACDAPDLPLNELAFSRMTWGEWRAAHPASTVFGRMRTRSMSFPDTVIQAPGIRKPAVESAGSARLPDTTPVIGLTLGAQSRAYVRDAMSLPRTHVVNDVVGHAAVTVTYCNLTDCVRVLTAGDRADPLEVSVHGILQGKLILDIDGQVFEQDAGEIPLADLSFTRTTWGQWKALHPLTDVFTGNPTEAMGSD